MVVTLCLRCLIPDDFIPTVRVRVRVTVRVRTVALISTHACTQDRVGRHAVE